MSNKLKSKILLVHNYYKLAGGEDTVFKNEKKLLEDNGHEVITYTRNNKEIEKFNIFRKLFLPITSVFSLKTYFEVKKIIKNEKVDIVHVHNTLTLVSPSVFYAAFASNIPVVQTLHNFRMICPNALFYRDGHVCEDCVTDGLKCAIKHSCYRDSKLQTIMSVLILKVHRLFKTYRKVNFICLTEFNKEKLLILNKRKNGQVIDEKKVFIKPNFTDIKVKTIPYTERKNQFVFVGRLEKIKGIDLLLSAWKEIKDSELIVCGTGPLENWCKEYVEKNGLCNINLKGFVKHDEVIKIIAESKALIMPSQWYEGFPMTIVESWACETPVIGSDIGNVKDLIQLHSFGTTFRYNEEKSLVRCLLKDINILADYGLLVDQDNYLVLFNIYKSIQNI